MSSASGIVRGTIVRSFQGDNTGNDINQNDTFQGSDSQVIKRTIVHYHKILFEVLPLFGVMIVSQNACIAEIVTTSKNVRLASNYDNWYMIPKLFPYLRLT